MQIISLHKLATQNCPIVILGVGQDARIAADILNFHKMVVYGFLRTSKESTEFEFDNIPVLGDIGEADYQKKVL